MVPFTQKVLNIVSKIPKGKVLTYKEVASHAGNSKASRAVGLILKKNFDPKIPCHRVIPSSRKASKGKSLSEKDVGEYNRGRENKIKLLKKEGAL